MLRVLLALAGTRATGYNANRRDQRLIEKVEFGVQETRSNSRVVRFGVFEADLVTGELRKAGVRVKLEVQPFQVLRALLERPGELVSREELQEKIWSGDTFVDFDQGINGAIRKIRDVLGDSATSPRFIETLPRRGYRFLALVEPRQKLPSTSARTRSYAAGAVAVIALAAIAAVLVGVFEPARKDSSEPVQIVPLTSYPGSEDHPDFSPDGSRVAFTWDGENQDNLDIYIREIGSSTRRRLTSDAAVDSHPAWSPDGRFIAFLRTATVNGMGKDSLMLIPAIGGPEREIAQIDRTWLKLLPYTPTKALAWSTDSKNLLVTDRDSSDEPDALYVLSVETGEKRRLTSPPAGSMGDVSPALSPDGRNLSFVRYLRFGASDVYYLPVGEGLTAQAEPKQLTAVNWATSSAWTSDSQ